MFIGKLAPLTQPARLAVPDAAAPRGRSLPLPLSGPRHRPRSGAQPRVPEPPFSIPLAAWKRAPAHPFLLWNAGELPGLRERLRGPILGPRWALLLRNAQNMLKEPPYPLAKVRWSLGICEVCAFAYAMTGEQAYGQRAKKEALHLLAQKQWHVDRDYNHGADLGTSEAALGCALVYDWCHDLFTAAERRTYRRRLLELSTKVYLKSVEEYREWWTDNPVSNWCGVCHGGNGMAALVMAWEEPLARRALAHAWQSTRRFLRTVNVQDGGGHEGVMYHLYGESFGHRFAIAAARVLGGVDELGRDATAKRNGYWINYMKGPDGQYANFNNMNESTLKGTIRQNKESGPPGAICAWYESQAPGGDRLLRWAADHGGAAYYCRGVEPNWFIWRSERPRVEAKPRLAPAVHFRGNGHAVLQSEKLWVAYQGGWISNASHRNHDLGTFVLVSNGRRMIHDPGYGFSAAQEHSTFIVGKDDQTAGARGAYLRFGSGRGFHYLASDLTAAYSNWLSHWVRHLVMVDGRYLVVCDDVAIASGGRVDLEQRFQTRGSVRLAAVGRRKCLFAAKMPDKSRQFVHAVRSRGGLIRVGRERLHVLPAAPADAFVETDKATLDFLRIAPAVRRREEFFVTVLYPQSGAGREPRAAFESRPGSALLRVTRPDGKTDRLAFGFRGGLWVLKSVNGASAQRVPTGSQPTVFRLP